MNITATIAGNTHLTYPLSHEGNFSPRPSSASSIKSVHPHPHLCEQKITNSNDPSGMIVEEMRKSSRSSICDDGPNGWNDETSQLALAMDDELGKVMHKLNVKEYRPLTKHYEVSNHTELSKKLKSIPSFKTLKCPLKEKQGKFYIDENSRYIVEDLPFGTCFIKYIASILGIETPNIDYAIRQIQPFMNIEFVSTDGKFNIEKWKNVTHFNFDKVIKNELKV